MRGYLIVATILAIVCGDAAGQVYRWVDKQGRVHYTQTPPPPGARDAQKTNIDQSMNIDQSGAAASSDLPYATQQAAKNFPVKLYTQKECAPCDDMRASLVRRSVPFSEINILTQKELDEVKTISGRADLPLIVVGSLFQSGYQEELINSLLDTAGYPASGPRLPLEALRKPEPAAPSAPSQPSPVASVPEAESK